MNPEPRNPNNKDSFPKKNQNRFNYRGRGNWYRKGVKRTNPPPAQESTSNLLNFDVVPSPYKGWNLYFHNEVYQQDNVTHSKLQALENYMIKNPSLFQWESILDKKYGFIDLKLLQSDTCFLNDWSSFKEDIFENPEHVMSCFGLAIHQYISIKFLNDTQERLTECTPEKEEWLTVPTIRLRPINYEPTTQLKDLKVSFYDKLVSIRGTVIRSGSPKLLCTSLAWKCEKCSQIQTVKQPGGVLTAPIKCLTASCRSQKFQQKFTDKKTVTVDWQPMRLQETVENYQLEGGKVPRIVDVELVEDLVGSCVPGDDVTIIGIVRVQNTDGPNHNSANAFLLYIDAVSLVNDKNQAGKDGKKNSISGIEFAIKDYYAIQKIHAEPDLLRLIVQSLCPLIFGHEIVKLGLLLGLFGGSEEKSNSRSDSHILIVGDPGLGKSQLLRSCANVAPRGVYVCGNTSTSTGLTVTLTRDTGGDFALEAGALILADQGICCVDEFDKISTQHQALLEAMEQQTISIAKGGVVCTLSAQCSILAAANPVGGHYNKAKTVSENIKLKPALLSRFDLIFILLDKPDEHLDALLSEHVLALHSSVAEKSSTSLASRTNLDDSNLTQMKSLKERLILPAGEFLDRIPSVLLRKYIAYARKYVRTTLSPAAAFVLQKFYIELRKQYQSNDTTPVTARQLQAMLRLARARARLELRELITEQDALDIVEIMRHSLVDVFSDGFGQLDFSRSQNGAGVSGRSQVKRFLNSVIKFSQKTQKSVFDMSDFKKIAEESGNIPNHDVANLVSTLNIQGFLIKKGNQQYKLIVES